MALHTVILDYETYYDKEYSLRNMTPAEYILDSRFEMIGCAVLDGHDAGVEFLEHDDLRAFFGRMRDRQKAGDKIALVSHNALFDASITVWRYGFVPDVFIDTMALARAKVIPFTRGVSLDAVCKHLGIGEKVQGVLTKMEGKHGADIKREGLWQDYERYAKRDCALTRIAYLLLREDFPPSEIKVMDMVIRACVLPKFKLNHELLYDHLTEVRKEKAELLAGVDCDVEDLMSNQRFGSELLKLGVDPPMKISPTTQRKTFAFAKTDKGMMELEEHPDARVQALVAARLGHKSTLEETRTERMLAIADLTWPGKNPRAAWMPVPLRYSGAHTHRFSGDWKLNLQNFPRGGNLRRALVAPAGTTVVAADASQIEARLVAWLAGERELLDVFANKGDPYSVFASKHVYRRTITKADTVERFVGKTCILGLGYGMGADKFRATVEVQSQALVRQGKLPRAVILDERAAQEIVRNYRNGYWKIKQLWDDYDQLIHHMTLGTNLVRGPVKFLDQKVELPNGMHLYYHQLHHNGTSWQFVHGGQTKYLFGGKLLENIVQALARIIITDTALRVAARTGHRFALQVHDELVYVVPDEQVSEFKAILLEEMVRGSDWTEGLPLDAEAGHGPNYGEAK